MEIEHIWFDLRRRAIALICAIVYCYFIRMSRKRKISYTFHGATSGNNKKKKREKDNEFREMNRAMYEVAEALRERNAIMRECLQYRLPPISGEETWNLIQECGCDTTLLPKIYCFLMKDINKLRTISQCPVAARKAVIMEMVFGSSNPPSN